MLVLNLSCNGISLCDVIILSCWSMKAKNEQ